MVGDINLFYKERAIFKLAFEINDKERRKRAKGKVKEGEEHRMEGEKERKRRREDTEMVKRTNRPDLISVH